MDNDADRPTLTHRHRSPARDDAPDGNVVIVLPPNVCVFADPALAEELMHKHQHCPMERCVWKAAAYFTLVNAGRLAPESLTDDGEPKAEILLEVLDKLRELASPPGTPA